MCIYIFICIIAQRWLIIILKTTPVQVAQWLSIYYGWKYIPTYLLPFRLFCRFKMAAVYMTSRKCRQENYENLHFLLAGSSRWWPFYSSILRLYFRLLRLIVVWCKWAITFSTHFKSFPLLLIVLSLIGCPRPRTYFPLYPYRLVCYNV